MISVFNKLSVFQNRHLFWVTRNWVDAYILFLIIKHLQPSSILEIGYFEGFSFSIMLEAAPEHCRFTSCDITYENDKLKKLITIPITVDFQQCKSLDVKLDKMYDFIMIDGEHEYHTVLNELNLCYNHLTDSGWIMIDDYTKQYPGVCKATNEFTQDHKMVQLLQGHQQIIFGKHAIDPDLKRTS